MKKKDRQNNVVAVLVLIFFMALGYYLVRPYSSKQSTSNVAAAEYHPDSIAPNELRIDWNANIHEEEQNVNYYALYPELKQQVEQVSITSKEVLEVATENDSLKTTVIDSILAKPSSRDTSGITEDSTNYTSDSILEIVRKDTIPQNTTDTLKSIEQPEPNGTLDSKCVIIVGAFKDPANVEKILNRLEQRNYTTTQRLKDKLTLVGVMTSCIDEELRKNLGKLRTEFAEDAYVE